MLRPELPEATVLSWHTADLIARRDLLRANAAGARHMSASFDEAADGINRELATIREQSRGGTS